MWNVESYTDRLLCLCLTIVLTVTEAAVQMESADEYSKTPTVGTSDEPDGQIQVEQLEMHCDEGAPSTSTSGESVQSIIITDHSPLQKLPVAVTKTSPYDIAPLPHASQRAEGNRKRKSESSTILTSTPHKDYLNSVSAKKSKPSKKLVFAAQSSEAKKKNTVKKSKKAKKCQPRGKKPKCISSSVDTTPCCICGKRFDEPPADSWTQCPQCTNWYHDSCGPEDTVVCYLCLA